MRKKLYSKLDEERNLRKVPKSFYTFRTRLDDITKDELIEKPAEAKFKIQTILLLEYKKTDDHKSMC